MQTQIQFQLAILDLYSLCTYLDLSSISYAWAMESLHLRYVYIARTETCTLSKFFYFVESKRRRWCHHISVLHTVLFHYLDLAFVNLSQYSGRLDISHYMDLFGVEQVMIIQDIFSRSFLQDQSRICKHCDIFHNLVLAG